MHVGERASVGALFAAAMLVAALLLVLAQAGPAPARAAVQGDQGLNPGWGVDDSGNVDFDGSAYFLAPTMAQAGAGWTRINFRLGACFVDWTSLGCNGKTALQTYDAVVARAQSQHLQVLGLISNESWQGDQTAWTANNAENVPGGTGDNAYIRGYATNAAGVLAQHFAASISLWEVWNEPNAWTSNPAPGQFTGASFMYPSNYAWLLERSYTAIKNARPTATVVLGGLLAHEAGGVATTVLVNGRPQRVIKRADMPGARHPSVPTTTSTVNCSSSVPSGADSGASYLCSTYSVGRGLAGWLAGASPFDDVGQHPYVSVGTTTSAATLTTYLQDLRNAYLAYEGTGTVKRQQITEFGWPTDQVTPQVQADNLRVAFQTFQNITWVARAYWFNTEDNLAANLIYGIVDASLAPKPSFGAYQTYGTYTSQPPNPTATPTPTLAAATATPTPSPTPTRTPTATPQTNATTLRLNSGGAAYTGGDGRVWGADAGFTGGNTYFNPSIAVANTTDQTLYQSERFGNFAYSLSVPNGAYTVTLKFAEIYWSAAGSRVFNVSINGQSVLTNFDILANTAPRTALDRAFTVSVTTGSININFTTVVDNAKVSAIEVVPAASVRINAGGLAYTSPDGRVWQADTDVTGGLTYRPSPGPSIAATLDPTLYQSERYGNFAYNVPLPNGSYTVTLRFAEIYWSTPGRRVFNVSINGQQVLTNFDILAQPDAAANTAVDRTFQVTVNTGVVNIVFTTVADNAKVSAIEINPAAATRINVGGAAYTGSDGRPWQADTAFTGGNAYAPTPPIAATQDAPLYQSNRFGNFSYSVSVPNGAYTVVLKFAEVYWTTPGRRVFNVSINGQRVLTNFDILAQPNTGPNTAVDRAFPIAVSNGNITIVFTTVVDNAQVNAIEIVPGVAQ